MHVAAAAAAEGAPPSVLATMAAAALQAPPPPMQRVSLVLGGSTEHLSDSCETLNSPAVGNTPEMQRWQAGIGGRADANGSSRGGGFGSAAPVNERTPSASPEPTRRPATVSGTTPASAIAQARAAVRQQHAERQLQQSAPSSRSYDALDRLGSSVTSAGSTPSGSPRARRSRRLLSGPRRNQSFLGAPFEEMFYVVEEEGQGDSSDDEGRKSGDVASVRTPVADGDMDDDVFDVDDEGELSSVSVV